MTEVKRLIRLEAENCGFDAVGFAPARLEKSVASGLYDFLADGRQGSMAWMENRAQQRVSPDALWPQARSVIVLGTNYGPDHDPRDGLGHTDQGLISVYARGKDYHDLVKKRLKRLARWMVEAFDGCDVKVFVDTAPVMEKPLAQLAGLGWQGKHTNLVSRDFGSWLFLGEVFTTLEIPPDRPEVDHCGTCDACRAACPTGALDRPYRIDARRCISYLTIEHKDSIPDDPADAMGNRIYGCDDCLAACPWTKFTKPHAEPAFAGREATDRPDLGWLIGLDDAAFREAFAGSPIKRTGRDCMVRNALIAIANGGDARYRPQVEALLADPSDLVRTAARRALQKI